MTATVLDGRLVADRLLSKVRRGVRALSRRGITPKLVIVVVGNNPASLSYTRQKHKAAFLVGIACQQIHLPNSTRTQKLIAVIERLNRSSKVHGILVQLPLPTHMQSQLVIRSIDPMKDVDGFQTYNLGKMFLSQTCEELAPCTPKGIIKLLEYYCIPVAGKHVVIIGRSNIVGKPLAVMLINRDATVTVCHSKTKNISGLTKQADILIAAVGRPKMIKAHMIKKGAVVIDVGVTKVENKLVGDVDFTSIARKASYTTPVPGGVGPMTVACLMDNVVHAAKRLST